MRRLADFDEGDQLRGVADLVRDPSPLLKIAGAIMVARSQQAFRNQGLEGDDRGGWEPRSVPNVAGVVADLARGPSVKGRRFQERPALVDTGALRASISFRLIGLDAVEVGSNLPYAGKMQEGGSSTLPINATVAANLSAFLKRAPQWRTSLGFLFDKFKKGEDLTVTARARQFVALTDPIREDIIKAWRARIGRAG